MHETQPQDKFLIVIEEKHQNNLFMSRKQNDGIVLKHVQNSMC